MPRDRARGVLHGNRERYHPIQHVLCAVWIILGGPWLVWSAADTGFALATIAYVGLGPTMLGNLFYLYGVAAMGPARAAAFLYLSPLFSAVFSIGWLGEQLAWYHIAGIAAIFSGLIILGYRHKPAIDIP